jgi:Tol biopolymer transport system component
MPTLLLRLTLPLTTLLILLVLLMQVVARLLPLTQIIPIVTYDSPIILLLDVNRHVAAARRTNSSIVFDAMVSPDQQRIAFSMSDNRDIHIFVGGLYDRDYQRLTSDTMGGDNPAWSSDGSQIAFVGLEPGNKRGIYTAAADGSSPVQTIVKAGTFANPAWSPDGQQLTFAASRYRDLPDLFVVESSCRLRCDRAMIQITNELVVDTSPVWSPDGSQIAFLSDRTGDYEIYELDMNCLRAEQPKCSLQQPRRIRLRRPIVPFLMLWSLDGREIFFRAWDAISNQPGLYTIKGNCPTLSEGCQPRLIYNLTNIVNGRRGS